MRYDYEPDYSLTCGTRRAHCKGPNDYRVVCATCGAGGTRRHESKDSAGKAAVRDSNKPCAACGAH